MSNILYFDAYSGLSGDMTLGALLQLGLPLVHLQEQLDRLQLPGYRLEVRSVEQHHITGLKLDVILDEHEHEHRSLSTIHQLIETSTLPPRIKDRAKAVFRRLAEVEARIHGVAPDEIHFHEVGAVDAIVDIVGSCIGFEYFEIDEFYCSALPTGSGFVRAAHGLMPVPAPATLQLLTELGATLAPVVTLSGGVEYPARGEMITPTGAALLATLCQPSRLNRPAMQLKGVGYGFGSRQFEWPNALRLWLGTRPTAATPSQHHTHAPEQSDHSHPHDHTNSPDHSHTHKTDHLQDHEPMQELVPENKVELAPELVLELALELVPENKGTPGEVSLLETNLDDMTPEGLGYLLEKLMQAEALDVYFTPIQMKKNRPATKLSVLARPADESRLARLILAESSTFGIRTSRLTRYTAQREFSQVETADGPAQVKLKILDHKVVEAVPEYESVAALARQSGRPWREIYEEVRQKALPLVGNSASKA